MITSFQLATLIFPLPYRLSNPQNIVSFPDDVWSIVHFVVSESYFLMNYRNNPRNLRSGRDFCKKPRLRYKLHDDHHFALAPYKYLVNKQCLPGCVVKKSEQIIITIPLFYTSRHHVYLKNDLACETYDNRMSSQGTC